MHAGNVKILHLQQGDFVFNDSFNSRLKWMFFIWGQKCPTLTAVWGRGWWSRSSWRAGKCRWGCDTAENCSAQSSWHPWRHTNAQNLSNNKTNTFYLQTIALINNVLGGMGSCLPAEHSSWVWERHSHPGHLLPPTHVRRIQGTLEPDGYREWYQKMANFVDGDIFKDRGEMSHKGAEKHKVGKLTLTVTVVVVSSSDH